MYDRNVEYPNRYQLVKVEGTDDIYDLVPAPGTVNNEGTLINKNSLLKDATAALFGLGADAVPDDVSRVLSRLHAGLGNEYVWEKTKSQNEIMLETAVSQSSFWNSYLQAMPVSSEVSFSGTIVSLVNPVTLGSLFRDGAEAANYLNGKYADFNNNGTIYYVTNAVYTSSDNRFNASTAKVVVGQTTASFGYVNSPDPNAYPIDDGYTYTPLGMLGEKERIETGSYVGTGKQGSSNKNSLTFNFEPMLLFIQARWTDSNGFSMVAIKPPAEAAAYDTHYMAHGMVNTVYATGPISFSGKNVSWYHNSYANQQLNQSGYQYRYIAIG